MSFVTCFTDNSKAVLHTCPDITGIAELSSMSGFSNNGMEVNWSAGDPLKTAGRGGWRTYCIRAGLPSLPLTPRDGEPRASVEAVDDGAASAAKVYNMRCEKFSSNIIIITVN